MKLKRAIVISAVVILAAAVLPNRRSGAVVAPAGPQQQQQPPSTEVRVAAASPEQAGRYIVRTSGCNDCHTPGFMVMGEKVPEAQWLIGNPIGFRGPWGTTYPQNLRRFVQPFTAGQFVEVVRKRHDRPPMPWSQLHAMSEADLKAVYRYLRSLGARGTGWGRRRTISCRRTASRRRRLSSWCRRTCRRIRPRRAGASPITALALQAPRGLPDSTISRSLRAHPRFRPLPGVERRRGGNSSSSSRIAPARCAPRVAAR